MTEILQRLYRVKEQAPHLKALSDKNRQVVLLSLAELIIQSVEQIMEENAKDLQEMPIEDPKYDRLWLNESRILALAKEVKLVATLPNPCGKLLHEQTMPNGLRIQKVSVPIGVVAVIFESRPNVLVDVFSLCFKAGNACVLKGGKEAKHTNRYLFTLIQQILKTNGLSTDAVYLLPNEREPTQVLLHAVNVVDVCIPRGGKELIRFVRDQAKIPVIETGAGIVHTYFDVSGNVEQGRLIINNAKTRRVSVCNALDTLLIHQDALEHLNELVGLLAENKVELLADTPSYNVLQIAYPKQLLHHAKHEDFGIEFLSHKMSVKTVHSVDEAIQHISEHTSGHSEAIIAEDPKTIRYFLEQVDAAALYVNTSTAFTDGGEFGMGAEIGISTQKLHARGPMGLEALTSYQWIVYGEGQIRK